MAKVGKRPVLWPIFANNNALKKTTKFASSKVNTRTTTEPLEDDQTQEDPAKHVDSCVKYKRDIDDSVDYSKNTDVRSEPSPMIVKRMCTAPVKISASHMEIMQKYYSNYYIEPKEKTIDQMSDVNQYVSYLGLNPKVSKPTQSGVKRRQVTRKFVDYFSKRDTFTWTLSCQLSKKCLKKIPGCLISEVDKLKSIAAYESACYEEIKVKKPKSRVPQKKKKTDSSRNGTK